MEQKHAGVLVAQKKNLNFSWYLAMTPKKVIDYVFAHEVAHLQEMNHSEAFWNTVEIIFPKYKEQRKWLKENGYGLVV